MKKLMLIPLLAMLSGCVSYYYPAVESSDGGYNAKQDQRYDDQNYTDYSGSYVNARYYPWWSVDYFYLGSGRAYSNFSIGFDYRYGSPWYDPFYGGYYPYSNFYYPSYYPFWYSFWYTPFYDHHYGHHYNHYASYDHYWRHRYNRYHRYAHHDHDRWTRRNRDRYTHDGRGAFAHDRNNRAGYRDQGRFSGNNGYWDNLRRRGEDGPVPPRGQSRVPARNDQLADRAVTRHVSVAPGSVSSNRGMEVRRREQRKPTRTRLEPTRPVTQIAPAARIVTGTPQPRSQAYVSSRTPAGEVRSRAGNKQGRTRTAPVTPGLDAPVISRSSPSSGRVVLIQRGSATVRSPRQSKPRPVRTQPVKSYSRAASSPPIRIAPARQQRPVAPRQQPYAVPRQQIAAPPRHQAAMPRRPQQSSPPAQQRTSKAAGSKSRPGGNKNSSGSSSGRNQAGHNSSRPEKQNRR